MRAGHVLLVGVRMGKVEAPSPRLGTPARIDFDSQSDTEEVPSSSPEYDTDLEMELGKQVRNQCL